MLLFQSEDWIKNNWTLEHGIMNLYFKISIYHFCSQTQIGTPFYIYGLVSLNQQIIYIISYITPTTITSHDGMGYNYIVSATQNIGNHKKNYFLVLTPVSWVKKRFPAWLCKKCVRNLNREEFKRQSVFFLTEVDQILNSFRKFRYVINFQSKIINDRAFRISKIE